MINYQSIIDIITSDMYVDKTDCFELLWEHKYVTIENCCGTGSSLFLKSLACFLDETVDTRTVFGQMKVRNWDGFKKENAAYCVLWLDFSDFKSTCFIDAIEYLSNKMSSIYKHYYKYFVPTSESYYDYLLQEYALDVIEKKCQAEGLQQSLNRLVYQLKKDRFKRNDYKLAILVDNLVALEVVADREGYGNEMMAFLEHFIVKDVYEHCEFFMQIGDFKEEENGSWLFRHHYMAYQYPCVSLFEIGDRFTELVVLKNIQFPFLYSSNVPEEWDWNVRVEEDRRKIQKAKYDEEVHRQEKIRQEMLRYAEELSHIIPMYSLNLGIRKKYIDKCSCNYAKLNTLLKDIYTSTYPNFEVNEIYRFLLKINEKERIIKDSKELENRLKRLAYGNPKWKEGIVNASSGHWFQIMFESTYEKMSALPDEPGNIKVYVCFESSNIIDIFVESLNYLLAYANNSFAAKIAFYCRSDQMCYWLSPKDFKHLENFFIPYSNDMVKSMPFVAYKGKLGISKGFPSNDYSHHSMMAHIIADYLESIIDVGDVNLENMYNNYIAKWNASVYEDDSYSSFKNSTALSLIVIMDTLDIILGDCQIEDTSFLLSDNNVIWEILASSHCWADVNRLFSSQAGWGSGGINK